MRQVTKDEFFKPIFAKGLDVHPSIANDRFPYTSNWIFHRIGTRPLYGKTVDRVEGGTIVTDYFVA